MTPEPDLNQSKTVLQAKKFDVMTGQFPHLGIESPTLEVVCHPGSVVILPFVDKNHILLIRNYRFAISETLWELPAGTLEREENPKETAARELIEETGYKANELVPLFEFFPTPGYCTEKLFIFTAKDLQFVGQQLNETEEITVFEKSFDEALTMIQKGEIHDGKTIASLLFYQQYYR